MSSRSEEEAKLLCHFLQRMQDANKDPSQKLDVVAFFITMIEEYVEYRIAERMAGRK